MNINGIDLRNGNHIMLQLCHNLDKVGVDIISLTESNVHWKKPNVFKNFERTMKQQYPKDKVATCIFESNIDWNTEYKSGGISMVSLNMISYSTIHKGQDSSGLGR